jgi:translocation and assembly module TamB
MSQLPPGRESEPFNRRLWLLLLRRGSIAFIVILLASITGGAWWLRNFILTDLVPLIQTNLAQLLGRPVQVGKVEKVTFNSIRFSSLNIPPTATDSDKVVAKAIDVQFNPLQVLLTRTLNLNVAVESPNVYLQQDNNGQWLNTQIKRGKEERGFITTNLESLVIRNASLNLLPIPRPGTQNTVVGFNQANGIVRILPNNQGFSYDVGASTRNNQGKVNLDGSTQLVSGQVDATTLNIQTRDLVLADITRLVQLPLTVSSGTLNTDLTIDIKPQAPISLNGNATLNQVSAKVDNIPQPITNTQGNLQFQGYNIRTNNLTTNFGKIPLQLNGALNTQTGYNLNALIKPVSFQTILNSLQVKSPVKAIGQAQANIKIQGNIKQPTATGTINTVNLATIDRFQFNHVSTNFRVETSGTPTVSLSDLRVAPTIGGQVLGSGKIQLAQNGNVNLNIQANDIPGNTVTSLYNVPLPLNIGNVSANANISGQLSKPLQLALQNLKLAPSIGGAVTANGNIQLAQQGQVNLNFNASQIPGNAVASAYNFQLPINIGSVAANGNVSGRLGTPSLQLALQNLKLAPNIGGVVTGRGNIQLAQQGQVNLNFNASQIPGNNLASAYNIKLPVNVGNVAANGNVSGRLGTSSLQLALQNLKLAPSIGGVVTGRGNIQLAQQGRVNLNFNALQIPGDAIARAYNVNTPVRIGNVTANANISGVLGNLQTIAQLTAPSGTVTANAKVENKRFEAFVNANNIQLNRFRNLQLPKQLDRSTVNTALNISGSTDALQLENLRVLGLASIYNVAGGRVNLTNINLNNGRWQINGGVSEVALNRFSENLRGRLNSKFNVGGTTKSFALANIRGGGNFNLSQPLSQLQQPVTGNFEWDGQQVVVSANTSGLDVNGVIAVNTQTTAPQITDLNLNVVARDFNLEKAPIAIPNLALAGKLDFTGNVTGNLSRPVAVGNVELRNFAVNNLAFDPVLAGSVNYQGGSGAVNLAGNKQDRIAVSVGANNRSIDFLIQRGESSASGKTQGDNLIASAKNFPVSVLRSFVPTENSNIQPLGGNISGNIVANIRTREARGDVAITQPRIGRIAGDAFQGNFSFLNGIARLENGQFQVGDGLISLNGSVETQGNRQVQVSANLNQTRIEKLLQALSIFEFEDLLTGAESPQFASAEVLGRPSIPGVENASLPELLDLFNQVSEFRVNRQVAQRQQDVTGIPALSELQGLISAKLDVTGSLNSGLNTNFNINGAEVEWGSYRIGEIIANGGFTDGILTLQPLRVGFEGGLFAFTGQLGRDLSGQLRVSRLPISSLQRFVRFPVNATGEVNALATLSGSLANLSAIGDVSLANATLNQKPIQNAQLSFNLNNARLNFGSTIAATNAQPLNIVGNIPAALPFGAKPESNQINITANVQNDGLSLLNVLTDQVAWVDGTGNVNVAIGGTLSQPTVTGTANVNNATLTAQALTQPLTNITGAIQFDRNVVNVESLEGTYNRGAVKAVGSIPILEALTVNNPLTVSLNDLTVKLQRLYEGGVSGDAVITGSVVKPILGGTITLANGEVFLPSSESTSKQSQPNTFTNQFNKANQTNQPTQQSQETQTNNTPLPIGFSDLTLILDENVRVTSQPLLGGLDNQLLQGFDGQQLLSFNAEGAIKINGSLEKPLPQGVIKLTGGRINLFTTQFVLERGYEQTATFTPKLGFDPILNVRLLAIVPESNAIRIPTSSISSEISDVPLTSLGTLRSVRVFARANGPASQLENNLELTSDPSRNRAEIVSLIGGTFVNALNQEDAGLGIISLAGNTLFTPLQGAISALGQTIGLSELRVYPTVINNRSTNRSSSVLGLAAEAGFNLNRNLSLSVTRVFIVDEPFRYNVIYRINDEILLRGSTDLSLEDYRTLVEYETRF